MLICFLCAVFQITFDHQTFYQSFEGGILIAAVNNVLGNADLLQILLAGVVMVGIYDD